MVVEHGVEVPLPSLLTWEDRMERGDGGLLLAWARGREMVREAPELAAAARRGELPVLPWAGGLRQKLKSKTKYGALQYVAMWQGLRGEPLCVDTEAEVTLVCAKFCTPVTFTPDVGKVLGQVGADLGEVE